MSERPEPSTWRNPLCLRSTLEAVQCDLEAEREYTAELKRRLQDIDADWQQRTYALRKQNEHLIGELASGAMLRQLVIEMPASAPPETRRER